MRIRDLLQKTKNDLQYSSATPELDTEILLSFIIKKNREFIFSNPEKEISKGKIQKFNRLIKRRISGEPVAYLTGFKNFYGRDFEITKDTLIPRPETESLVEKTLEYIHKEIYPSKKTQFIDLGTGSGCILITLAKEISKTKNFSVNKDNLNFIGTDISPKALKIATKNHKRLFPEQEIKFLKSNLLDFLNERYLSARKQGLKYLEKSQTIIIANLPYLSEKIYKNCPKSVINFEPQTALLAKKEGLDLYLKLLEQIKTEELNRLSWSLYLILEISPEQKPLIEKIFPEIIPEAKIKFSKDLAQKWRFVEIVF